MPINDLVAGQGAVGAPLVRTEPIQERSAARIDALLDAAADVEKEREIVTEISRNEGKPEAALPKIVEGRVTAYFKQVALLEQDYAKDNKLSVSQVAKDAGITVTDFARFKVGA